MEDRGHHREVKLCNSRLFGGPAQGREAVKILGNKWSGIRARAE